jgi:hypothetical protein
MHTRDALQNLGSSEHAHEREMYGVPDASPFNGAKHSFHRPTFAADAPQIGSGASPAASSSASRAQYPPASGRRSGRSTGRSTGRSRSTEPISTFRSEVSSYSSHADDRASLPGLFPPRANRSFECVRPPPPPSSLLPS